MSKFSLLNCEVCNSRLNVLQMWEESQAENTKLRLELSGVRSDLETAKHQLDSAEKKVDISNTITFPYFTRFYFPGHEK